MVYETRDLWAVDASVLLTRICGHLTSMLYAVAERTADVIEKSNGNRVVEPWEYMYFRLD